MFNKKIGICLIILLFLSCGVVSAFDLFGDGLDYDDIYMEEDIYLDTSFSNESFKRANGDIHHMYVYSAFYELSNVSSSLKGTDIITYFYHDGDLVVFHDEIDGNFNNTTFTIDDDNYHDKYSSVIVNAIAISDKYVNVTHFKVVIIKDNKLFSMSLNLLI